jgi:hypothetical protein
MNWRHLISASLCVLTSHYSSAQSELKQGSIHPNAAKIEFDKFDPFQEGFAVITKGEVQALIDKQGNLLVPYGKYRYPQGFVNGMCRVEIGEKGTQYHSGFIDRTGKLVIPCIYEDATPFNDDGYAYVTKTQKQISDPRYLVIDRKGKETMLAEFGTLYYNKRTARMMGKKGIIDQTLKLIRPIQFDGASEFHDGLCAVAKKNEFGEFKWGFVDTSGNMVVPFMFSLKPDDFQNGLVKVYPPNKNEFDYAYLDRNGDFKIIVKGIQVMAEGGGAILTKPDKTFRLAGFTELNYTTFIFDSLGNVFNLSEALVRNGTPYKIRMIRPESIYRNHILFTSNLAKGIANADGTILIAPLFWSLSHFDHASSLARAEYHLGNNKYTVGYVNEQGVFMIVKKETSGW